MGPASCRLGSVELLTLSMAVQEVSNPVGSFRRVNYRSVPYGNVRCRTGLHRMARSYHSIS